jgi:hypothetical protein
VVLGATRRILMKTYQCKCHVCGREFDHAASFMATGWGTSDGRAVITCNVEASLPKHSREEIVASYKAGGFAFKTPA